VSLISLSQALLWLGYVDQARLRQNEVLSEARRLSPYTVAFATTVTWVVDWAAERTHAAARVLASADEALAISAEQGYPLWLAFANGMRGWSLTALAQPTEGLKVLRDGALQGGVDGRMHGVGLGREALDAVRLGLAPEKIDEMEAGVAPPPRVDSPPSTS
jgi:hypothetical protein